ncbi:pectinesterase [Fibrella aestuarina BUZ 2]|uniref:Pectinesterase n=1 Tax=Fibrella aestuarina BUZ 2 TaxID=1166018 RepID=I0KC74_9BACT|nr:pectinesterase family protein [Fibrella aestuarina]CCH01727.1 pectinesterase [Fibrella aestuarina BUZ 2]
MKTAFWTSLLASMTLALAASKAPKPIVVSADGKGDFTTIQAAIDHVSQADSSGGERVIFIRNGRYPEKLFIDKRHFLTLRGESEKGVQIVCSQARDMWRCDHPDDNGAATLNVNAHDLRFERLTLINDYGFRAKGDTVIACTNESGGAAMAPRTDRFALPREAGETPGTKRVRKDGHQFAMRSFPGAIRLVFKNCTLRALGGDTVSPWDVVNGLYYFKDCTMEGAVDLYCPRGWAYAEGCRFICHNLNAAIWHDGSGAESARTVLKNCTFVGDDGFKLGRYHRDAQFYLIGCRFAQNMADADIYWVTGSPAPPKWGRRVYYYDCHRRGGDYAWHKDNLPIPARDITVAWTFEGKWHPRP